MINLLLGAPGAGKSYEAVVFHVLPALMRGRMVITNLPLNFEAFAAIDPGFPALIEVREKTLALPPDRQPDDGIQPPTYRMRSAPAEFVSRAFANPEDFASPWKHVEGFGPLYVIDECHFCMPAGRTSVAVEEWMSMHRHYNADVLLITQSSNKISRAIRDLVQVCYKVRKAVALGKPDGYIRKVLDGVNGGEVATTERKYKPQYFPLWRSHTQGQAIAEVRADDVAPLHVKFKRFSLAFYAVTACALIYAFWPGPEKKPIVVTMPGVTTTPTGQQASSVAAPISAASGSAGAVVAGQGTPTPLAVVDQYPDPYASKFLHIVGRLTKGKRTQYSFAISAAGQRIGDMTSDEMKLIGYRWEPLTDCAGYLRWRETVRALTCDAPVLQRGSSRDPVVIAVPAGSATPIASSAGTI